MFHGGIESQSIWLSFWILLLYLKFGQRWFSFSIGPFSNLPWFFKGSQHRGLLRFSAISFSRLDLGREPPISHRSHWMSPCTELHWPGDRCSSVLFTGSKLFLLLTKTGSKRAAMHNHRLFSATTLHQCFQRRETHLTNTHKLKGSPAMGEPSKHVSRV